MTIPSQPVSELLRFAFVDRSKFNGVEHHVEAKQKNYTFVIEKYNIEILEEMYCNIRKLYNHLTQKPKSVPIYKFKMFTKNLT